MTGISREEAHEVAMIASREATRAILRELGLNAKEWQELQKDFAWLRRQRQISEKIGDWTRKTVVVLFVSAVLGIFIVKDTEVMR